jgi:pilus assembly protein FimV
MRPGAIKQAGYAARLWMLSVAVSFAANANAAGPGDIQANGNPDGMDKAEVAQRIATPTPGETKPAAIKKPGVHSRNGKKKIKPSDKLTLTLSMTLSIPGNEPVRPRNSTSTGEALQQDSITREKKLSELNAQIAEVEQSIKAQQKLLDISANSPTSRVTSSGALAQNAAVGSMQGVGNEQPSPKIVVPDILQASKENNSRSWLLEMSWIKPAIGLGMVLLAVPGFIWYRRYQTAQQWKRDSFHDLTNVHDPELVLPPEIAQTTLPVNEQINKPPAYDEENSESILPPEISQSILPPEYEMLEEADIYLRFGHDKLAEEVLREAIKVNPKNPQVYLRLLRIYFAREDSVAFLALAQHMKPLGDGMAWAKAAEMGRNLDPDNVFYS